MAIIVKEVHGLDHGFSMDTYTQTHIHSNNKVTYWAPWPPCDKADRQNCRIGDRQTYIVDSLTCTFEVIDHHNLSYC